MNKMRKRCSALFLVLCMLVSLFNGVPVWAADEGEQGGTTETVLVWAQADYDPKTEDYVVPAKPDYQEGRVFANVREDSVIYFALAEKNTQGAITVYENVRPATSGAITVQPAPIATITGDSLKPYEKNAKEGLYTLYSEVSGDCYVTCKDTSVKNSIKLALNKIAARWPAKAVAQFFLTLNKKQ